MAKQKSLGIDFDGTLCKKQPYGDGTIWQEPNEGALSAMKKLKEEGYYLFIFTVRMSLRKCKEKSPEKQDEEMAWKEKQIADWLKKYNIPYDEITNSKHEANAYVDDRAVRFTNWHDITNYFTQ